VPYGGFKFVVPFLLLSSRLADLVGFGVAVATGMQYLENFPDRVYKSMLIPLMMEDKRAGKIHQTTLLFIFQYVCPL
jgi:hypothetical protein